MRRTLPSAPASARPAATISAVTEEHSSAVAVAVCQPVAAACAGKEVLSSSGNAPRLAEGAGDMPGEDEAALAALLALLDAQNTRLATDQRAVFADDTPATSHNSSPQPDRLDETRSAALVAVAVESEATAVQTAEGRHHTGQSLAEWGDLLANWDSIARRKPKYLAELVRRGVPDALRGMVWQNLARGRAEANASTTLLFSAKRVSGSDAAPSYAELLAADSEHARLIRRDIARTFPGHEFFQDQEGVGQEVLFNVIKA